MKLLARLKYRGLKRRRRQNNRAYPFRRTLTLKNDTIYIFGRVR